MDLLKRAVWWSNRADCSHILDKRARISRAYSSRSPRRHGTRDSNRFRIPRWSSTALGERAIAPPGARVLCRRDTLRIRRPRATDRLYRNRSVPSSIPAFRTVSIVSCNLETKRKLCGHNIWVKSSFHPHIQTLRKEPNKDLREDLLTSQLMQLLNKMSFRLQCIWYIYIF